jgi:hypothetical protein
MFKGRLETIHGWRKEWVIFKYTKPTLLIENAKNRGVLPLREVLFLRVMRYLPLLIQEKLLYRSSTVRYNVTLLVERYSFQERQ